MATYKNPHGDDFFYKSGSGFADLFNSAIRGISNNKNIIANVAKNTADIASKVQKIIKNKEN